MRNPFRYFNSSPEVIRLVVMMCLTTDSAAKNASHLFGGGERATLANPKQRRDYQISPDILTGQASCLTQPVHG
jgi:hypothetical protein